MTDDKYDLIVAGVGGIGSAALFYAAEAGYRVLGIDRYIPGHDMGSSHGRTRAIRQAYFEHPNYVPLAQESFKMWGEIEERSGQSLLIQSGILQVGHPDSEVVRGVLKSCEEHDLPIQRLTSKDIHQEFPCFHVPEDHVGLVEECAGILLVDQCVLTLVELAKNCGAEIVGEEPIVSWDCHANGITVHTRKNSFQTDRLVLTPGAWAPSLMARIGVEMKVLCKHQHWFTAQDHSIRLDKGCPAFLFENDGGDCFYGFPQIDDHGLKVAEHTGGTVVTDPTSMNRQIDSNDVDRIRRFMNDYFVVPPLVHHAHAVCLYTMSPDSHFIVDQMPGENGVVFACGLSGHGYKFAPVIGKYLVDLSEGHRRDEFTFLSVKRFAG